MPRTNDTKAKMVASAALLLREEGIARTGFRDVVEHSGTPRGSIAHHFPDGKRQMVGEAVRFAGGLASDPMRRKAATPEEAIANVQETIRLWITVARVDGSTEPETEALAAHTR